MYRIKNSGKITLEKKRWKKKVEKLAGKKMKYGHLSQQNRARLFAIDPLSHQIVLGFSPSFIPELLRIEVPEGKKTRSPPSPPAGFPAPASGGAGTRTRTARAGDRSRTPGRDRPDRTGPGPGRDRTGTAGPGPDRGRTGWHPTTPPAAKGGGGTHFKHHSTALKTIHCSPKLTQGHRITPNNKKKKSYLILPRIKGHTR